MMTATSDAWRRLWTCPSCSVSLFGCTSPIVTREWDGDKRQLHRDCWINHVAALAATAAGCDASEIIVEDKWDDVTADLPTYPVEVADRELEHLRDIHCLAMELINVITMSKFEDDEDQFIFESRVRSLQQACTDYEAEYL